jgi:sugar phosphate isomerase/epimerase
VIGGSVDLSRCAVHTITTKPWPIETAIDKYARAGFGGITVWRDTLAGRDVAAVGRQIRDAGLAPVAVVRGGFFPYRNAEERARSLADNQAAIREAAALGAEMVVLVCGAIPGQALEVSRQQIVTGIADILPLASELGVKLAIEPLHPMYANDRSAVNDLTTANDIAAQFGSPLVGVAVDVYHVWWDPRLEAEIARCGANGWLFAFHVCDWLTPTTDFLLDRGLMGEGCIPIRQIRGWVERAGFGGFNEVEIFSSKEWAGDQDQWLARVVAGCATI